MGLEVLLGPKKPHPCPQLQELHRAGGDLLHRDAHGRTLLHHAVSNGCKEVVRYLLDHGEPTGGPGPARWRKGPRQAPLTFSSSSPHRDP